MDTKGSEREPIIPPRKDHPDDKMRSAIEAGVEVIPFASSVTKLAAELIPTQAKRSADKWEAEISNRTNENTDRIDQLDRTIAPTTSLTPVAVELAVALAREPGDGMRGRGREREDLCKLVPTASRNAVEEAAFELESLGLCEIDRALGNHWWLRLTQKFYEQIDHQVMGWTTKDDAWTLAQVILKEDGSGRTSALHAQSGWNKRRFNPAFKHLLQYLPGGRVSREVQPDYPASSIVLIAEDRAALRRFVAAKGLLAS